MTSNIQNSDTPGETASKESSTSNLTPPQNEQGTPASALTETVTTTNASTTSITTNTDTVLTASTTTTSSEPPKAPTPPMTATAVVTNTAPTIINADDTVTAQMDDANTLYDFTDNGIFDFMTPEMAIELYQRIHSRGVPDLDWKFYGRRKPNNPNESDGNGNQCDNIDGTLSKDQQEQDTSGQTLDNTEFDFDESFSELQAETSVVNDSLKLKNRPEPGSERKTNLSDIMSDILKETSHTETE